MSLLFLSRNFPKEQARAAALANAREFQQLVDERLLATGETYHDAFLAVKAEVANGGPGSGPRPGNHGVSKGTATPTVHDANHKVLGRKTISFERGGDGSIQSVTHNGKDFSKVGTGTNIKDGAPTTTLESEHGSRIHVHNDLSHLHED